MLNITIDSYGHWLPQYYHENPFHPCGNSATGHSIPAVLPQVLSAKPRDFRSYRGITAVPITVRALMHCQSLLNKNSGQIAIRDSNTECMWSDNSIRRISTYSVLLHHGWQHKFVAFIDQHWKIMPLRLNFGALFFSVALCTSQYLYNVDQSNSTLGDFIFCLNLSIKLKF